MESKEEIKEKKLGALLVIWLILMIIGNLFTASYLLYLLPNVSSPLSSLFPNVPSWIFYIYGLAGLANIVFIIFLFMWKKWAFFALCGSVAVACMMALIIGLSMIAIILIFGGPVILYLILKSRWNLLK